jgi:Na+-transporting methylmalonyl-CoA/oxaloacetate decarboxylase gamma subunit
MIFVGLIFLSALLVSGCAAFFSVAGLISIFSSAPLATGIMGGSLELAKLVAASWLYRNWGTAPAALRYYFASAIVILSIITSLGIFGYLSKAHLDQSVITGSATGQLQVIDEKIVTHRENINANRKALKQMDEAVDQVMGRSSDEKGADKAVALRRTQQKERGRLLAEIEAEQKAVGDLNEARAPIAADVRRVEAEVGPIKYVAELIYGNSSEDMIGRAVRLVIMSLIFVFDPLAILMVIAGNMTMVQRQAQAAPIYVADITMPEPEPKPRRQRKKKTSPVEVEETFEYEATKDEVDPDEIKLHKREVHHIPPEILDRVFNKSQGTRPGHPHANAQQPSAQEDAKSLITLKKNRQ